MNRREILFSEPVTQLLQEWRGGDDSAMDRLAPLVYEELRRRAEKYMKRERNGHTLCATALVHEAYLKMVGERDRVFQNRVHFCALAAKVMKDILKQYARARNTKKRGGKLLRITLNEEDHLVGGDTLERAIDLVTALDALAIRDKRKAQIMEMFYFTELTVREIAEVVKVAPATANRDLQYSRAWLKAYLEEQDHDELG